VYQGRWSIYDRDFEREIIPMAKSEGMALCPFRVLGGGRFKTEEEKKSGEGRNIQAMEKFFPTNQETMKRVIDTLEKLAKAKGSTITGIALSYVMQKVNHPNVNGADIN
jgi:aryl-alcohol dehydrogenase-like predicted oxidoreductase